MSNRRMRGIRIGPVEALFLYGGEDNSQLAFPHSPSQLDYCARYGADFAAIEKMQPLKSVDIAASLAIQAALIAQIYERIPVASRIEAERQIVADEFNKLMGFRTVDQQR